MIFNVKYFMFPVVCAFAFVASSMFLSCSSGRNNEAISGIDTTAILRYRLASDPPTLDVAHSTDTESAAVLLKMFDGLVQFDPITLSVKPAVAKSWKISDDGLAYTFHLRKHVFFHSGRRVNAEDFKYSFERILDPKTASERVWVLSPIKGANEYNSGRAQSIAGIVVPDSFTLLLRLEKAFAPFLSQLCMEAASVVPREDVEREDRDFSSHPIGCGPFRFKEWKRGSEVILDRFERYYGEPVKFKGIRYKIFSNVQVAFQQYLSGDLDFLTEIPQGRMKSLEKTRPKEVQKWPILGIYYYGFHLEKPPFKGNLLLRKAISHAIDRKKICDVIFEKLAVPARGILPPGIQGHDSTYNGYAYDIDKAKSLLAEAGYPEGKGLPLITLWFNQNERHSRVAQYVQAVLSEIGIKIRLKELEWGTYLQALREGEPAFYRLGWVADLPDADNFLYPLLHSSQSEGGDNHAHFQNSRFDSLVDAARMEKDPGNRVSLYQQADRLAMENAVWIMISYSRDVCLIKPEWKGFQLSRQGDFAIPLERMYKINE